MLRSLAYWSRAPAGSKIAVREIVDAANHMRADRRPPLLSRLPSKSRLLPAAPRISPFAPVAPLQFGCTPADIPATETRHADSSPAALQIALVRFIAVRFRGAQ
jgi:hypothetical protein